jgi:hypothetical protein
MTELQAKIWAAGVISAGGTLALGTTNQDTLYLTYYISDEDGYFLRHLARVLGRSSRRVHEKRKKKGEYILTLSGEQVDEMIKLLRPWLSEGRLRTYKNAVLAMNEVNERRD